MKLVVLVVEDEPPVREAVLGDLEHLGATVRLEAAQDVDDAWAVVEEVEEDGTSSPWSCPTTACPGAAAWTCSWR